MDPVHPIVALCIEGMQAEMAGRPASARALFLRAWTERTDAFDACVAAHYVARHQDTPEQVLHWNAEALSQAEAVEDDRVQGFFPSLYLNLGHSYEVLGELANARRYYELAAERLDDVADGRYGDVVRSGVAAGRARVAAVGA